MGTTTIIRNYRKPIVLNRYDVQGVHFDGSTQVYASSITCSDNSFNSFSGWVRIDPPGPTEQFVWQGNVQDQDTMEFDWTGGGKINYYCDPGPGSLSLQPNTINYADGEWHHVIASLDCSAVRRGCMIVDGVDVTRLQSFGSGDQVYAMNGKEFTFGSSGTPHLSSWFLLGDMAEMWVAPGISLLDSSGIIPPATVAKFFNNGYPVFLGKSGERPLGTSPPMYMSGDASTFATNLGSGGSFSVIAGSLTTASGLVSVYAGTAWDRNQMGSKMVLSNNALTATSTGVVDDGSNQVRSISGRNSGVRYAEVTIDIDPGTDANGVGVVSDVFVMKQSTWVGETVEGAAVYSSGDVWYNNSRPNGGGTLSPAFVAGDVIGVWFDTSTKRLSVRKNGGNWNGNVANDPNTGYMDMSAATGTTWYLAVECGFNGPVGAITANFKPSGMSLPSGASRW